MRECDNIAYMDELPKHKPYNTSRRPRRVRLSLASALILAALILLSRAAPAPGNHPASPTAGHTAAAPSPDADGPSDGSVDSAATSIENAQPGLAHVDHDVDGDTIDITLNGRKDTVRFIGVDTPETHDPRKPVQCYGPEAAAHTKSVLEGQNVRLAADPQDSDRDKYGRLLRYVYLPDGTLYNAQLITDGWGFAYTIFPFSRLNDFRALQASAKASGRGLWSTCNVNSSSDILQTAGSKT